jgi:hypothetical protein
MGEGKRNAARFVCYAMNSNTCPTVMWGFFVGKWWGKTAVSVAWWSGIHATTPRAQFPLAPFKL